MADRRWTAADWVDDYGKDHECYEDPDHEGGHQCGCGARVPAHLIEQRERVAAALALLQPVAAVEDLRTHHEHCHQHHAGCLATRTIATLTGGDHDA